MRQPGRAVRRPESTDSGAAVRFHCLRTMMPCNWLGQHGAGRHTRKLGLERRYFVVRALRSPLLAEQNGLASVNVMSVIS